MKKLIAILMLAVAPFSNAQDYSSYTNILATNVLAISTHATLPTLTNYAWIDTHSYKYTSFQLSFRGSNSDSSGVLKVYALQTWDRYGTNYFSNTNLIIAANINGNTEVSTNATIGPDYFSGYRVCAYEVTGTSIPTNVSLRPIQKGYLLDR